MCPTIHPAMNEIYVSDVKVCSNLNLNVNKASGQD